jgi:hypothetical protein
LKVSKDSAGRIFLAAFSAAASLFLRELMVERGIGPGRMEEDAIRLFSLRVGARRGTMGDGAQMLALVLVLVPAGVVVGWNTSKRGINESLVATLVILFAGLCMPELDPSAGR